MFHSRFARGTSLFVFVTIFTLLLGACSSPGANQSVPHSTEAAIEGESGQQPEVPDAEPSGGDDQDSVDEGMQADIERWRAPIGVTVILSASCEGLIQTAEKRASGDIDGIEAFGELLAAGIFIQGADEGLVNWTPGEGQGEYKGGLQDHVEGIKAVVGSWVDDEIDSSEANVLLIPLCDDIKATFEDILKDAENEGVTSVDVEALITELGDSLGELDEGASTSEEEEDVEPEAATPEHGMGRLNPYPPGAIVNVPNWEIQVLDVIRGEVAWSAIKAANMFNDEPRNGMEYISIKVYAKSVYEDEDEHSISSFDFNLTGDRLIRYNPASVVDPEPALDATLYTGGDTEGWISFEVAENEGNLILIFDEMANWNDDRLRYIAIAEGASFDIPTELSQIQSSELGMSRLDPAPFGETLISSDWEITILETVRGEQAWSLIEEANMFNDLPDEGMEYILTKVRVRYIGDNEHAESIDSWAFESTGDESVVYDVPAVVDPDPPLDVSLFPGGVFEGWVTLQAAEGESGMNLIFELPFDFSGEKRFLSLDE